MIPGSVWEAAGLFQPQEADLVRLLVESECWTLISLKDEGGVNDQAQVLVLTSLSVT